MMSLRGRLVNLLRRWQPDPGVSVVYGAALAIAACSWIAWYRPAMGIQLPAYLSSVALILVLVGLYLAIDALLRDGWIRAALAGFAGLLTAYVVIDAALLSVTSIRLHHAMTILQTGGDLLTTLDGAGFTWRRLLQITLALTVAFLAGSVAHRILPRAPRPRGVAGLALLGGLACLGGGFIAEQTWHRHRNEYHVRDMTLPGYVTLYSGGPAGFTETTSPPLNDDELLRWIPQVGRPQRPLNVVYFLLESVSHDVYAGGDMPNLAALAKDSLDCRRAFAAGGHTPISWNVLLLDRQAATVWVDVHRASNELGSAPLRLLHAAGYDIQASISTLFDYKGFARRVLGTGELFSRYFQAVDPTTELGRVAHWNTAETDRLAADQAIAWIHDQPRNNPFFLLVNLDATHYPYRHDEQDRHYTPAFEHESSLPGVADSAAR